MQTLVLAEVPLRRRLRRAVRGERRDRRSLRRRDGLWVAVDRCGGGQQDATRAGIARRLEHRDGARHVDLGVERRVDDRLADVDLRGEVHDDVGPGGRERPAERAEVAHVDRMQLHAALLRLRDPRPRAAVQVVGHRDLGPAIEQRVDEMRSDEAGTAGDDHAHAEQS